MHLSGYSPYSKYSEFVCSVLHATYYEREFPKTKQYFFPTNIPSECFTQKGSGWFFMSKEFYAGKSWLTSLNWWKSIWKVSMNTRMIRLKYVSWFFWLVLFWSFFVCVWNNCADYFVICLLVQDFTTPGVRFFKCHVMQLLEYSRLVRLDFSSRIFHLRSCKPIL